jgi:methanogenic corrinoid protein MtbC1
MQGTARGMEEVGRKYEAGEYFLSELILAGEAMKKGMEILRPHLTKEENKNAGKVVIGTVRGDLHDIGKGIVTSLLEGSGFEVYDLGVDVPAEAFLKKMRETNAAILGMSSLLTTTMHEMEDVNSALKKSRLRKRLKVIVGGAAITESFARRIGADAYARDAVLGAQICRRWTQGTE